jgi:hypothetical protein
MEEDEACGFEREMAKENKEEIKYMSKMERANLVRHHISYKPSIVKLIPLRQHQEIHGNIPINTDLTLKMRQYDKLVKVSVMMKNWRTSYEKEFGCNPIDIGLEQILNKKKELLKDAKVLIKNDLKKVKHIKGLGIRHLAGLLAYAHPKKFPSLRKYLFYCGFKDGSVATGRYSRKVHSLVHQIVVSLIRCKDDRYYPLYKQIKDDLGRRFSGYSKAKIDGMARNRVGTYFLKEVYKIWE